TVSANFIEDIARDDLEKKAYASVVTRFPPEPNGYLHIGHAKSICLNFGLAAKFGGATNLRFDDTNPSTEEVEYVESIMNDVRWLGFDWGSRLYYASDYFEKLYEWAELLIKKGKAYVCDLSVEQISEYRGNFFKPGVESPDRGRSVEENLDLFRRMRAGEFADGTKTLRAKIDMQSPNMNLRDPPLYRIKKEHHHRTGDRWCIYPMYDYAHGQCDAIEGVTHSICTLEFENHRPLYDWCLDEIGIQPPRPKQIEFARLNISYTVLSKRKLLQLVGEKHVAGWDDPRMPTLAGLRRRGYTPEAIRAFAARIGVARRDNIVDMGVLELSIREDLEKRAARAMGVLRPLKVVIENYDGSGESFDAPNHPDDPSMGSRKVPFSKVVWIERDDFREDPPKKFFRLAPGREVRLRYACLITCKEVVKDAKGEVVELRCTWDPASRGGNAPDGRRVKGTIHWVSAEHALDAEVRLYDRLFSKADPDDVKPGEDWKKNLNPRSLEVLRGCKLEPSLAAAKPGDRYQLERMGYFCVDPDSGKDGRGPVFNRTVPLRDSWAKIEAGGASAGGED
ncbi:MAG TPA: glutamine--tRNA ligase/YqeY domain fusion protein, partial [Planctomycetota bacterium]|nr:glutamine--tRNA ligase/YqeY domain fusion protein [Planctomycetota bacterium]